MWTSYTIDSELHIESIFIHRIIKKVALTSLADILITVQNSKQNQAWIKCHIHSFSKLIESSSKIQWQRCNGSKINMINNCFVNTRHDGKSLAKPYLVAEEPGIELNKTFTTQRLTFQRVSVQVYETWLFFLNIHWRNHCWNKCPQASHRFIVLLARNMSGKWDTVNKLFYYQSLKNLVSTVCECRYIT